MEPNHHRDSVRGEGPQRVSVRFEAAPPMAIPIGVAANRNDWRRMVSFMPDPSGGRILNLQGARSAGRQSLRPYAHTGISNAEGQ